jgi:hypothetical protein
MASSPVVPKSLTMVDPGADVVAYLKLQHAEIKGLFAETLNASGDDREAKFLALRRLMATHEATEEELVHPAAERALGAKGREIVMARLGEERTATTEITEIERLAVDSLQFEMALRKLEADVVRHATREENDEFPVLSGGLQGVHGVVRDLYVDGQTVPGGQRSTRDIGPFVAMLNHARDLLAGNRTHEGTRAARTAVE